MKIVLLGYMASGKSSIAKRLAELLEVDFIDLDAYISKKEGFSIPELFAKKGEIYFRKMEALYLNELLNSHATYVLALGGGTPCYSKNMDLINKKATSIYLNASLKTLHYKLSKEKNKQKRPLIAHLDQESLMEFIGKHLFERNPFYQKATHTVHIDDKSKKQIALEISKIINLDRP